MMPSNAFLYWCQPIFRLHRLAQDSTPSIPCLSVRKLLALVLTAAGCGEGARSGSPGTNVLLVTIDTLRADHVGCYGNASAATPTLDGLAARGVRFATAVSHVPLTGPSHASILTGRTPLGHGFRDNGGFVLPADIASAPAVYRQAGYSTGAFVSGFPLDRRFGMDRGFDVYDDHLPRGNDRRRTPYVERFANATTDVALRWLETAAAQPGRPFFAWIHYYDPHAPYEPPGDFGARFRGTPYDGEIAFVDQQLARVLGALERSGALSRTLVVVIADHGESLGEHGEGTHGLFVYDATLRVPFIVAGPGVPKGRVSTTVARAIDVLPTLLDLSGHPPLGDVEGRSLRPALEGREMQEAPAYAESLYGEREYGWAPLFAIRTARFKWIEAPRPEFYDLDADARETTNRLGEQAEEAARLKRELQEALARPVRSATAELDPEAAERLAALGYVAGRGGPAAAGAPKRDPKDGARLLPKLNHGVSAARTEPERAIAELTEVLREDPDLIMARRARAVAYEASGRFDRAIAELGILEKQGRFTPEDHVALGDNLRFAGRTDEAMKVLERAARENPKFVQPWLSIAEIQIKRGDKAAAASAYDHVLSIVPDHIEALRGLGDLALLEQQPDAAGSRYEQILRLDHDDGGALTKLGVVRMQTGRQEEAMALFRKVVEREPKNAEALLYLAGALASSGRPGEAIPFFERALTAGPRSAMALNGLGLTRQALGDRKGAAEAFRESLRLDPRQPDVAQALRELGRP
jgi:choline-sulfatase